MAPGVCAVHGAEGAFRQRAMDGVAQRYPRASARGNRTLARALETDIQFHCFLQYCFHKQWQRLRKYANDNGIRIIGDLPIYVPLDSADVWSHPENFQLTRSRRPRVVAGCPPDGFSRNGQFWGNPIYDWDHMAARGFDWWLGARGARRAAALTSCRIDHFPRH